ncbi:type II toxin-antitoxin system PemK/MazF family toxin [Catelliglobosispora koreensis]|uniref:type II toxin-antitoxin system PemK/MazF family toxin n=1 Tax=Catelliglobosispora koreensis TaxID=129052 RepID=UPI00036DFFDD|nr:type II toxin-antitoxin system PemK/MazF family toxin [Catelliglobosispora koreensis]
MSPAAQLAPWQVWWVEFDPQVGREQAGRRPGIIVGSALACSLPNGLALLIPCTSTNRNLPWQPPITLDGRDGYAMCDQVKALSKDRLAKRHKALAVPDHQRPAIAFAVRQMFITA